MAILNSLPGNVSRLKSQHIMRTCIKPNCGLPWCNDALEILMQWRFRSISWIMSLIWRDSKYNIRMMSNRYRGTFIYCLTRKSAPKFILSIYYDNEDELHGIPIIVKATMGSERTIVKIIIDKERPQVRPTLDRIYSKHLHTQSFAWRVLEQTFRYVIMILYNMQWANATLAP